MVEQVRKYAVGIPGKHVTKICRNRDIAEIELRKICQAGGVGYAAWCIHNTAGEPKYTPKVSESVIHPSPVGESWWRKAIRKLGI